MNKTLKVELYQYKYVEELEGFYPISITLDAHPYDVTLMVRQHYKETRGAMLKYALDFGTMQIPILDLDNTIHLVPLDDIPASNTDIEYEINNTNIQITPTKFKMNIKTATNTITTKNIEYKLSSPLSLDMCFIESLTSIYKDGYLYGIIPSDMLDDSITISTDFFDVTLKKDILNNMLDSQVEFIKTDKPYIKFNGNFLNKSITWHVENGELKHELIDKQDSQEVKTRISEIEYLKHLIEKHPKQ